MLIIECVSTHLCRIIICASSVASSVPQQSHNNCHWQRKSGSHIFVSLPAFPRLCATNEAIRWNCLWNHKLYSKWLTSIRLRQIMAADGWGTERHLSEPNRFRWHNRKDIASIWTPNHRYYRFVDILEVNNKHNDCRSVAKTRNIFYVGGETKTIEYDFAFIWFVTILTTRW